MVHGVALLNERNFSVINFSSLCKDARAQFVNEIIAFCALLAIDGKDEVTELFSWLKPVKVDDNNVHMNYFRPTESSCLISRAISPSKWNFTTFFALFFVLLVITNESRSVRSRTLSTEKPRNPIGKCTDEGRSNYWSGLSLAEASFRLTKSIYWFYGSMPLGNITRIIAPLRYKKGFRFIKYLRASSKTLKATNDDSGTESFPGSFDGLLMVWEEWWALIRIRKRVGR